MIPAWLRSILFLTLFTTFIYCKWETVAMESFQPVNMIVPVVKHIFNKYIRHSGEYSECKNLMEVFSQVKSLRCLTYLPINGGPKFVSIYKVMAWFLLLYILLVGIPSKYSQIFGFMLGIAFTTGYVLFVVTVRKLSLDLIEWPIYAVLGSSTLGLFFCCF